MRPAHLALLVAAALTLPIFGVTLTVGNDVNPNSSDGGPAAIRTDIDLVHPATHSGQVATVKLHWSSSGCTNAVKVKFFRRVGDTLTPLAQRGPFTPTAGTFTVSLTPPVDVQQGDLIALSRLSDCGNPGAMTGFPSEGYLQYSGDVTVPVAMAGAQMHPGGLLALSGSGPAEMWMARVIPVVGSTPGAYGAQFKTEMQFFNPQTTGTMICILIFHPAGAAGSASDPLGMVQLDPGQVFTSPDIVAAMHQSGTGSLDIWVPVTQSVPMILTRVYNDAGGAGTSSLTEEPVEVTSALEVGTSLLARGVTAFLVTPHDPYRTRFNIGVRTLFSGAVIRVTLRNSAGVAVRTVTHTYTATTFVQTDADSFVGGPITGDESIQISVDSGSAIVYGSTTDNTTNDPAIQFAYGIWAIA